SLPEVKNLHCRCLLLCNIATILSRFSTLPVGAWHAVPVFVCIFNERVLPLPLRAPILPSPNLCVLCASVAIPLVFSSAATRPYAIELKTYYLRLTTASPRYSHPMPWPTLALDDWKPVFRPAAIIALSFYLLFLLY